MLSVNTHDQISGLPLKAPDAQQFEMLQRENQRIKEAVESAWDRQGFPTFQRYLRDFIEQGRQFVEPYPLDDSSG
jgi:predicted N-acyltransferase